MTGTGSPPHTRGKVRWGQRSWARARITPAYAGKSEKARRRRIGLKGSPPHTRGKGGDVLGVVFDLGITPAYAGKRVRQRGISEDVWDHPRIRGEKEELPFRTPSSIGSPPHTRGKVHWIPRSISRRRITPAYAGKSQDCRVCCKGSEDHPRIRGEKLGRILKKVKNGGSPPHTRGKGSWLLPH